MEVQIKRLVTRQVFTQFINQAEQKLTTLETLGLDRNIDLAQYIQPNADFEFDSKLESLAIMTRHAPKLIIDGIMIWRSTRVSKSLEDASVLSVIAKQYPLIPQDDLKSRIKKRNSLISNFILCRTLIRIVQVMGGESIHPDLGKKLEDMVFAQLRSSDPDQVSRYVNLESNITLFSTLMGALSTTRFTTITERFIGELKDIKGIDKQSEMKMEMMIRCMRFIQLRIYPLQALEDSADCVHSLGELFTNSHSGRVKGVFCEVLGEMLEPVAKVCGAEVNIPVWQRTIEGIAPKVMRMIVKGKSLSYSLSLMTTLLSVSKHEYFLKHWPVMIEICVGKLKERGLKSICCSLLCKLVYVYLYRCIDSPTSVVHKRLEYFIRVFFPGGRKVYPTEVDVDVLTRFVYYVLVKYPEYGMDRIVKVLVSESTAEEMSTGSNNQAEQVPGSERILIATRAFMLLVGDLESTLASNGKTLGMVSQVQSTSGTGSIVVEGKVQLPNPPFPNFKDPFEKIGNNASLSTILKTKQRMGVTVNETMDLVNEALGRSLRALETTVCEATFFTSLEVVVVPPPVPTRRPSTSVVDTLNSFTGTQTDSEQKQGDVGVLLLCTILDGIPRFRPSGMSIEKLVGIVAKCTVHENEVIQKSAMNTLLRIAKMENEWDFGDVTGSSMVARITIQYQTKTLVDQFEKVWSGGEKLQEMVDSLVVHQIELLEIWLANVKKMERVWSAQECETVCFELEAHGLVLLLGPTNTQRTCGIKTLKLALEFHSIMSDNKVKDQGIVDQLSTFHGGKRASVYKRYQSNTEFIGIYEVLVDQGPKLVRDCYFDPLERASKEEVQQKRKNHESELFEMEDGLLFVAQSGDPIDTAIWERCLPQLVKYLVQYSDKKSMKQCLDIVWSYLKVMHPVITSISSGNILVRTKSIGSMKKTDKAGVSLSAVDILLGHWKTLLTFAYTAIDVANTGSLKEELGGEPFKVQSAAELHRNMLPLLGSDRYEIRKAVVSAVGSIPSTSYGSILGDIQNLITQIVKNSQLRLTFENGRKHIVDPHFDRMRTELTHLLSCLSDFTQHEEYRQQFSIMTSMVDYMRAMIIFFNDAEVYLDWKHQMTRYYFCIFVEKFYSMLSDAVKAIPDETVEQYIPFKLRHDLFGLFESWCGFGLESETSLARDQTMMAMVLEPIKDAAERLAWTTKMEVHKRSIQLAALKAMVSLCKGSLNHFSEPSITFEMDRLTAWMNQLLDSPQSRYRTIARSAIENILSFNINSEAFFEHILENCYSHQPASNITAGYFLGMVDLLARKEKWDHPVPKIVCLTLYHMCNDNITIRKGAARLLLILDKKLSGSVHEVGLSQDIIGWYQTAPAGGLEDDAVTLNMDQTEVIPDGPATIETTAICSSLPLIYNRTRLKVSQRLAKEYPQMIHQVLSEVMNQIEHFRKQEKWAQCQVLLQVFAPWVSHVQLEGEFSHQVPAQAEQDPPKESQQTTFTLINNIFFLTVVFGNRFVDEIAGIWKSLVDSSDNHVDVVNMIIDIILMNVLSYQNQTTVNAAKSVSVAIAHTNHAELYFDSIMEKIVPHSLGITSTSTLESIRSCKFISSPTLYYADLQIIGMANPSKSRVSPGYLLTAFVVDMTIEVNRSTLIRHLPLLLTVIFIHLDASIVKTEEMRLLLVNLIQIILNNDELKRDRVNATIAALNIKEGKRVWKYEDNAVGKSGIESEDQLGALALALIDLFEDVSPSLRNDWAYSSLQIGSTCRDYHLASRSLQLFRKLCEHYVPGHLGLLIWGFGHCISDQDENLSKISNELILCLYQVLKTTPIKEILYSYPQIFWTSVTLLGSLLEWEYLAGLNMISMILKNLDLTDNKLIQQLLGTLPHKWPSGFDGLLRPLLRGLSSSETESTCIDIINSLLFVSVPVFLDSRPSKFLFVSLANAPRLLQIYSDNTNQESIEENLKIADLLALAGSSSNCDSLARLFTAYANQRISKAQDFLKQLVLIIRDEFALFQWEVIRFCLGLLRNKLEFYPECALLLLEYMLKDLPPWTEAQSQEMEFSEAWLMPLIGLLDTPQYSKAAHVLDALLSGRIKSTEAEMTTIVGGSHNLYNYVKRARTLKIPDYTETGWIKEKESGDVRKRIVTVAKSCEQLEKPKIYKPVQKLVVNNRNDLLQQFKELEIFFRSSLSQPQE